jgi:hypothetical protein
MRIFRDGSIQHIDAYGNAYTSTATGVMISSIGDIRLEAAGSIYMSAGQTINILSRLGTNITSMTDSVRIKCAQFLEMFAGSNISATAQNLWQMISLAGQALIQSAATVVSGDLQVIGDMTTSGGNIGMAGDTLSVNGTISAIRVEAAETVEEDEHPGHIYQGFSDVAFDLDIMPAPVPTAAGAKAAKAMSLTAKEAAASANAEGVAYQTPTQQFVRAEGLSGQFTLWDISSLTLGGTPIPWTTSNKVFNSTEKMNIPSTQATFANKPSSAMTSAPTQVYVQP